MTRRATESPGAGASELMVAAVEAAARDGGAGTLLKKTSAVLVPHGTWSDPNPGRIVAEHIGARGARTIQSEVGVLQQSLITRACVMVARGQADCVVVCGAEDKHSSRLRAGASQPDTGQERGAIAPPDEVLTPGGPIVATLEVERGLTVPAVQYAIIDNALRHEEGQSLAEQRAEIAEMWAAFARVGASNPDAWDRSCPSAEQIATVTPSNRMIASPYTKLMCSQWNVDQAGALVIAATGAALDAGVPRDALVFPLAACESNHVTPLVQRPRLGRWPAFGSTARRALELAGLTLDEVGLIDLYSCFPAAVRVQARELGIAAGDHLTVTGGMTYGGGPFNNYVLQSTAEMVRRLREERDGAGLVTTVSGLLSKPAAAIWSSRPTESRPEQSPPVQSPPVPSRPAESRSPTGSGFRHADTTAHDAAQAREVPLAPDASGTAIVRGYTVVFDGASPDHAVAVLDVASGSPGSVARTVATSFDAGIMASMLEEEWTGRPVRISEPGTFR